MKQQWGNQEGELPAYRVPASDKVRMNGSRNIAEVIQMIDGTDSLLIIRSPLRFSFLRTV